MIKEANLTDLNVLIELARKIWSDSTVKELNKLFTEVIRSNKEAIFVVLEVDKIIGFAYFSIRHNYVEGTNSTPVGYLEGIYIMPRFRKLGFGRMLIDKGIDWAREKGCQQMGSDCELDNNNSIVFHKKSGFKEVNRIVCFVKDI